MAIVKRAVFALWIARRWKWLGYFSHGRAEWWKAKSENWDR